VNGGGMADIEGARPLALLGDSITTDHISPAGAIKTDSPAGSYLVDNMTWWWQTSTPTGPVGATTKS
jgi:aconitase A